MRGMLDQTPNMDTLTDELIEIGKTHIGKHKFEPVKADGGI